MDIIKENDIEITNCKNIMTSSKFVSYKNRNTRATNRTFLAISFIKTTIAQNVINYDLTDRFTIAIEYNQEIKTRDLYFNRHKNSSSQIISRNKLVT